MGSVYKFILPLFFLAPALCSCEHIDEEPPLNLGYDSNIVVPDPVPLTHADSLVIQAQQAEYDQNAK